MVLVVHASRERPARKGKCFTDNEVDMLTKKVMNLKIGDVVLDGDTYIVLTEPVDRGDGSTMINTLVPDGGTVERAWLNRSIKEQVVEVAQRKDMDAVERFHQRDTPAQRAARAGRAAEHQARLKGRFYGPSQHKQTKANAKRKKAA